MSRESQARRITTRAAYGGGGVVLTTATAAAVLGLEAWIARRRVGEVTEQPYRVDGLYSPLDAQNAEQTPLGLVILGDSAAAGLGADAPEDTPGILLARGLAEVSGHPVRLVNLAVVGAQTSDVMAQIEALQARPEFSHAPPDVVVVLVGANDVTHRVMPSVSVGRLGEVVRRLRALGSEVVVGTCPDLGTIRPLPQPLRAIGRRWSRRLAAAQMITVVEAGGRAVSLGALLGPEFDHAPQDYFSSDRFHPSSLGYRRLSEVIVPTICAALGYGPEPEPALDVSRHEEMLPLAEAAVQAADTAGSELAAVPAKVGDRPIRGRLASVRHRVPFRRHAFAQADSAADAEPDPDAADPDPHGDPDPLLEG